MADTDAPLIWTPDGEKPQGNKTHAASRLSRPFILGFGVGLGLFGTLMFGPFAPKVAAIGPASAQSMSFNEQPAQAPEPFFIADPTPAASIDI